MSIVVNLTDPGCLNLIKERRELLLNYSIIILEYWEYKSSSPYPKTAG